MIALNPDLDVAALAATYAETGRVRIQDFLDADGAARLQQALLTATGWRQVINGGAKVFEIERTQLEAMDAAERQTLDAALIESGRHGFQYRYDSIRVPDDAAERRSSGRLVDDFATMMSSDAVLAVLRRITDAADVTFADAQATAYHSGDFLTQHDDDVPGKNRRAAYVFGLTEGWRREWGGQLLYHLPDGASVAQSPGFNTLDLFRVPQPHSVSYVAPFADRPRLSITGWLRAA